MAQQRPEKISELPEASTITPGSFIPVVVDGVTSRVPYEQVTAPSIPAPRLIATSNVTISGVQTVDGVSTATLSTEDAVLLVGQTDPTENGYRVPSLGAWTLPSFYDSDADVAAALGQTTGAALDGAVNAGKTYYQFVGDTLAGAKTFVPTKSPAEINANEAPWFLVGDGVTAQDDKFDSLLAYAGDQTLFPTGCTVRLGQGTYLVRRTVELPRYVNLAGAGKVATEIKADPAQDPFDVLVLRGPLNIGLNGSQVVSSLRVTNNGINNGTPVWVASSGAIPANGFRRPVQSHSHVMKLTTKSGNTGAFRPIGELTPYSSAKMLGTANANGEFLLKFITPGALGVMQFQLSVNAGTTWSATQNTTEGDYNDFVVDTVMGGSTYGAACKVRLSNIPSYSLYSQNVAAFTMPAVAEAGITTGEVVLTLTTGNTNGLNALAGGQQGWVFITGAGLMWIKDVLTATTFTAVNVGASSAAAPGALIGAGAAVITVLPPSPRIEVIGTPPSSDYTVDILPTPGPLGRSRGYYYGAATVTEANKHKLGTIGISNGGYPTGGVTTVAGAYHDWAIPATSLTIRVHTGILSTSGSWTYFTPAAGWSMQEGTTVADGANVWTVHKGPACIRTDGVGHLNIRDVRLSGGSFNLIISQAESVRIEGNCTFDSSAAANIWVANGDARYGETPQFANNIEVDGNVTCTGAGYSLVHDGGFGFTVAGGYSCQQAPSGWIFLAGLRGGLIEAQYLESVGQGKTRNAQCFGRGTSGTSANGIHFSGGYWGSVTATSCIDLYNSDGLAFTGIEWGGSSSGLTGCAGCTNLQVTGGQQLQGRPIIDANPSSGFVSVQGFLLSIGADVRATASLTMVNGANVAVSANSRSDYDITGPTAVFSADGFVAGTSGQRLKVRNRTSFAMTVNHEAGGATAANRIITPTGAAVSIPPGGAAEFEYSSTDTRWVLIDAPFSYAPTRTASGATDAIVAADLGANVQYTNAGGCAITLNTLPAGFSCVVSAETAGALTFVNGTATLQTAIAASGATTAQYQTRTLFWRTATSVRIT